jgi:TonB family protein
VQLLTFPSAKSAGTSDNQLAKTGQMYVFDVESILHKEWAKIPVQKFDTSSVTVTFRVSPQGVISNPTVTRTSKNTEIDALALKFMSDRPPLPPLPKLLSANPVDIELVLHINRSKHPVSDECQQVRKQARELVAKGSFDEAITFLQAKLAEPAIAKDEIFVRELQAELVNLYYDQATLLSESDPKSPVVLDLTKKALALDPDCQAAKELLQKITPH